MTRISFWLSGRGRVVFLVRGPAPGCARAGTFAYAGHRGLNHVRFTGAVRNGRLRPGRYTISPMLVRGAAPARRPEVGVAVRRNGSVPARVSQDCSSSAVPTVGETSDVTATPSRSTDTSKPRKHERDSGVLGAFKPPDLFPWAPSPVSPFLKAGVLTILLLLGAAMIRYLLLQLRS